MRIISGIYKGRNVKGYEIAGTRPTQDRVKESLFGMIQNDLRDANVLDLFAGSGNLGLEALSNGASNCVFVDRNSHCIETISINLKELGVSSDQFKLICADYLTALKKFSTPFDLVFLDPPYRYGILSEILIFLEKNQLISEQGFVVCEYEKDCLEEQYGSLVQIKHREYGYKKITIYRKEKSS